jgi:hypothetical protein
MLSEVLFASVSSVALGAAELDAAHPRGRRADRAGACWSAWPNAGAGR